MPTIGTIVVGRSHDTSEDDVLAKTTVENMHQPMVHIKCGLIDKICKSTYLPWTAPNVLKLSEHGMVPKSIVVH